MDQLVCLKKQKFIVTLEVNLFSWMAGSYIRHNASRAPINDSGTPKPTFAVFYTPTLVLA